MRKTLFIIPLAALCLASCGTATSSRLSEPPTQAVTTAETTAPETTEAETTEAETLPVGKKKVVVAGYKKSMNDSGAPIITIYYEFTNNTSEESSWARSFSDNVSQGGKELMSSGYTDEAAVSQTVAPGETVTVGIIYEAVEDVATEVEITDLFGQEVFLKDTLE